MPADYQYSFEQMAQHFKALRTRPALPAQYVWRPLCPIPQSGLPAVAVQRAAPPAIRIATGSSLSL
jgi:hypothetical protein